MANIAWIDGSWNESDQLSIPLNDRGLNFGDGIFETILIYKGIPKLLEPHLERWNKSAKLLGMAKPPSLEYVYPLIEEAIKKLKLTNKNGALRLNWSRGRIYNRQLEFSSNNPGKDHQFWLELNTYEPSFKEIKTMISNSEYRNAKSCLTKCKTFAFGQSIYARNEAKVSGYDDAILRSTNGDLCCGTTGNLLVLHENQWFTPNLQSGCLPGIMRGRGLQKGIFTERSIPNYLNFGEQWLLINSLGCRSIIQINNQKFSILADAKKLWLSLL